MQKMEAGKIRSIWDKKDRSAKQAFGEDIDWEERIEKAYNNKLTLEYTGAHKAAQELLQQYTADEIKSLGEAKLQRLYPDITDAATIAGAAEQLEEMEKAKQ